MSLRLRPVLAAAVLLGGGLAAASTLAAASPSAQTVTLSVPDPTVVTVTVDDPPAATPLDAAWSNPAQIGTVRVARTRRALTIELQALDAFLAARPKLRPYRAHLWYVAHHTKPRLSPRRLASLLWCTVWFPHDCE